MVNLINALNVITIVPSVSDIYRETYAHLSVDPKMSACPKSSGNVNLQSENIVLDKVSLSFWNELISALPPDSSTDTP